MRSIKLLAPGQLEIKETGDRPEITDSTVRVAVEACGICGSDLALYNGRRDLSGEHYFGHDSRGLLLKSVIVQTAWQKGCAWRASWFKGCGRCWVLPQRLAELLQKPERRASSRWLYRRDTRNKY